MTTPTTAALEPAWLDVTKLAVGGFLARYREPTLTAYKLDLKTFLGWCEVYEVEPLRISWAQLELYLRYLGGLRVRGVDHGAAVRHGRDVLALRGD